MSRNLHNTSNHNTIDVIATILIQLHQESAALCRSRFMPLHRFAEFILQVNQRDPNRRKSSLDTLGPGPGVVATRSLCRIHSDSTVLYHTLEEERVKWLASCWLW